MEGYRHVAIVSMFLVSKFKMFFGHKPKLSENFLI